MSDYLCVLSTDVQDRIKEIGDGSIQDGAVELLKHWESQPTESEKRVVRNREIEQKQAELQEKLLDD